MIASFKGGIMQEFNIILGGKIDVNSVNTSINDISTKIQPLEIKVKLNLDSVTKQIQEFNLQIQESLNKLKSGVTGIGGTSSSIGSSVADPSLGKVASITKVGENTTTVYKKMGETFDTTTTQLANGTQKIKQSFETAEHRASKLDSTYGNLKARIENLGKANTISKDAVSDFSKKLEEINKIKDPTERANAFKQLGTSISDSKKQAMGFGEQLRIAYSKFAIWSIATVTWYGVVRALKDMVKTVTELDKSLTSLQMVAQASNQEMAQMTQSYIKMGKELGATLTDVISAADDYLRAGKTVEETNQLITSSTILSKIANIDAADATTYLISAMNAYGLEASQVISVVDKLSAVDIAASVSSEGLAIAMSKTASSAKLAGVSMDKLFGYIAAVKEVSQESDEAIGNFYKTLFARMQQVKIGSLVDSDGEDISDTSRVLKQYGISILDATGDLRNMGNVLDELSGRWDKFTTAQKSEIATTLAGVRQRDRKQRRRLSTEMCFV